MKNFDNTIQYYELLMYYGDTSKYKKYELPSGFHFEFYKPGDEDEWVSIHISSGEFTSIEKGLKHFRTFYAHFIDELNKRCVFLVEDETNKKVGTVTVSLLKEHEYGCDATVDWLAIRSDYQGKGLCKPLLSKTIELAHDLGHKSILLHTQTTSWLAAKIYLDYGFEILNKEETKGWNILKTIVNHPKLEEFSILPKEDIYDKRNVEIKRQLDQKYGVDNYNYGVWYKEGNHKVYVYYNNTPYEFDYFIDENGLRLEEVKDKKYKK